jgi:heme exporter protein D
MHWDSMQAFMDMGGYAGYVWGSVGATVAAMAIEVLMLRQRMAGLIRQLKGNE